MKLTKAEKAYLALTELDADQALAQVAKKARMKISSIQRARMQLIESGVIAGITAIIDYTSLGVTEFALSIKLVTCSKSRRKTFEEKILINKFISWFAAVGGDFDYMLNITAASALEAKVVVDWISEQSPAGILNSELCIRTERIRFWRGYLGFRRSNRAQFKLGGTQHLVKLSDVDLKVLRSLQTLKFESFRELAANIGIPIATYLRHIKSLQERKILLGFGYRLDVSLLSLTQYRLLLRTSKFGAETREKLQTVISDSNIAKLLTIGFGAWNFEIEVDAQSEQQLRDFLSSIEDALENSLINYSVRPIFKHLKYISFPIV